ncbi:MAG: NADH-quinone oxidoreductase subunit L [Desulfovibrio sp.]|uniref:NADH-quinone oxidoreductase subunit 5 family protein n=1 Tax=Desulfovibrio sp. 7SRBS1 TaxID=3378064 RepID=UPI003B3E379C
MLDTLLFFLIVLPFLAGAGCYFLKPGSVRSLIVMCTGAVLAVSAIAFYGNGSVAYSPGSMFGISVRPMIQVLDFLLLFLILFYGFKLKSRWVQLFTAFQIVLLSVFELFMVDHAHEFPTFYADQLSMVMVLVISIVGSLICLYAIPYMKTHEGHLKLAKSKQPQFFLYLVGFLGAMNGMVLSNDIVYFYFFFEITTFCSFMLIGHDQTEIAIKNATRALILNAAGGAAFVLAMVWAYTAAHTLDIQAMIKLGPLGGAMLLPLALLCLAGFTKAAQFPFQSWLLGAMVAPTPVSALLHSSTMVKAGVFIVLRFAPAFQGTFLSDVVAVCGAFTFLAGAGLAVSQSNAKKILAYSTISNLGLIIACAGLNTPLAITAATLLIIFHAVSKGLLFLCVGYIEQGIHSRDIEDMRGLSVVMPKAARITLVGLITMMLPPFGVLLGKWMAIEAASDNIFVIVLLALGSALTVLLYTRWGGNLMSAPYNAKPQAEHTPLLIGIPLNVLAVGAVVLSLLAPVIYMTMVGPMLKTLPFHVSFGVLSSTSGAFAVYPLFLLMGIGFAYAYRTMLKARTEKKTAPYMCGIQTDDATAFIGPIGQPVKVTAGNYYLENIFGETKLTLWVNLGAAMLLALMIGGAL